MAAKPVDDIVERIEIRIGVDENLVDEADEIADKMALVTSQHLGLDEGCPNRIVDLKKFRQGNFHEEIVDVSLFPGRLPMEAMQPQRQNEDVFGAVRINIGRNDFLDCKLMGMDDFR